MIHRSIYSLQSKCQKKLIITFVFLAVSFILHSVSSLDSDLNSVLESVPDSDVDSVLGWDPECTNRCLFKVGISLNSFVHSWHLGRSFVCTALICLCLLMVFLKHLLHSSHLCDFELSSCRRVIWVFRWLLWVKRFLQWLHW